MNSVHCSEYFCSNTLITICIDQECMMTSFFIVESSCALGIDPDYDMSTHVQYISALENLVFAATFCECVAPPSSPFPLPSLWIPPGKDVE